MRDDVPGAGARATRVPRAPWAMPDPIQASLPMEMPSDEAMPDRRKETLWVSEQGTQIGGSGNRFESANGNVHLIS